MKISARKLIETAVGGLFCLVYALTLITLLKTTNTESIANGSVISALCVLTFAVIYLSKKQEGFWSPSILFLLSFYLFQNGQLLLRALGVDFNQFYINTLSRLLPEVCVFSSISTVIACYSAIITANNTKVDVERIDYADCLDKHALENVVWIAVVLTGIIAIPLVLIKSIYALSGGYRAVRNLEGYIPSVINFVEYMFMPFSILLQVYSKSTKAKISFIITFVWLILTALCGDRTTGIAGLFILLYVRNSVGEMSPRQKRKMYIRLAILAVILIVFVRVAYVVRTQRDFSSLFSESNFLVSFIEDIGFSCFPLFTMMSVVPSSESFLHGSGYFLSLIGGMIPSFIDPTGTIAAINRQSRIFETWQGQYFGQYSFGFGFSLNAEAYINFGWWGLFAIFAICLFVFSKLKFSSFKQNKSGWQLYRTCILLFLWFTLPRRDSYYIWKALVYSIFLVKVYLKLFCKKMDRDLLLK